MIEFLSKFENRSIKFARVNSILITKSINLQLITLILCGAGVRCDIDIFIYKPTASAQSFNREVCGLFKRISKRIIQMSKIISVCKPKQKFPHYKFN